MEIMAEELTEEDSKPFSSAKITLDILLPIKTFSLLGRITQQLLRCLM